MAKALIIDDEIDICYLLSTILRSKSLEVSYVNNLFDASASLADNEPEIIFLDNYLPDGIGVDYVQLLKARHPYSKIVMITAFDNLSDRNKAHNNGADSFIAKPFTKEHIYQAVDTLVNV